MHEDVYRMYIKIPSSKMKNIDFYHQIENVLENEKKIYVLTQVQAGNNR